MSSRELCWIAPQLKPLHELAHAVESAKKTRVSAQMRSADRALQEARLRILAYLCGMRPSLLPSRRLKAFLSLEVDEVAHLLLGLNFLFVGPFRIKQPFEVVWSGLSRLHGPGDGLNALSGEEFHFAELFYNRHLDGDPSALNCLMACLYRQAGSNPEHKPNSPDFCGDQRRPFNRATVELDALKFESVDHKRKGVILWWYQVNVHRIVEQNPGVFTKKGGEKAQPSLGWLPVFRALAKDPLQVDQISKMKLSRILYELNASRQEAISLKSKLKKR